MEYLLHIRTELGMKQSLSHDRARETHHLMVDIEDLTLLPVC